MSLEARAAVAAEMTERVGELLAALSDDQLEAACWPMTDDERERWFYTPTDHGGLPLVAMSSAQRRLVWRLVAVALSEAGYNTAALIAAQEDVLDRFEGFGTAFGRERGRDPLLYWIAVFGDPGAAAWSWRLGGHHLSLHFVIVDGAVASATPCFMGADPASAPLLGPHLHRPLAAAEDLGRELARSLDDGQAAAALVSSVPPPDLVTANRTTIAEGDNALPLPVIWRGRFEAELDARLADMQRDLEAGLGATDAQTAQLAFTQSPKGVRTAELRSDQREVVDALVGCYVDRLDDRLADGEWARVRAQADELHFLWAGSLEPGQPHYYRIQGGDVLIEYDNAQRGGNHVHTVWRDLSDDFGRDALADHRTGH